MGIGECEMWLHSRLTDTADVWEEYDLAGSARGEGCKAPMRARHRMMGEEETMERESD